MPDITCTIRRDLAKMIYDGEKLLEMRPAISKFKGLQESDRITFHWCSGERLIVRIMSKPFIYKSAKEALEACGVETILPGKSFAEAMVPCLIHFQPSHSLNADGSVRLLWWNWLALHRKQKPLAWTSHHKNQKKEGHEKKEKKKEKKR